MSSFIGNVAMVSNKFILVCLGLQGLLLAFQASVAQASSYEDPITSDELTAGEALRCSDSVANLAIGYRRSLLIPEESKEMVQDRRGKGTKGVIGAVRSTWPELRIPYKLKAPIPPAFRTKIASAMGDITDADCYYFEDATSADTDYLMIEFSTHCQSVEGYMRGAGAHRIQLSIACFNNVAAITHLLMVALGARHTHNRHDRDNYVTVKWDNIKSAGVRQFWRDDDRDAMNETAKLNRCAMAEEGHDYSDCGSTVAATITGPFDWDSIMLFSSLQTQLAINPVLPVLTKADGSQFMGGQCLSDGDKANVKLLGGCDAVDDGTCYRHRLMQPGTSTEFRSSDISNTCRHLISAKGSTITVEVVKFIVPAPGKVTFFDGEVADLDTKVDDFFSGPNDATSNYAERMQFDDFFVLDLILSMDGGPMTDYIIHVSVEAKPATAVCCNAGLSFDVSAQSAAATADSDFNDVTPSGNMYTWDGAATTSANGRDFPDFSDAGNTYHLKKLFRGGSDYFWAFVPVGSTSFFESKLNLEPNNIECPEKATHLSNLYNTINEDIAHGFVTCGGGCSADPVEANRRIWDGSKTTGTQAVYVCDDGRVSYGVCKEDGTWDYRSINNNNCNILSGEVTLGVCSRAGITTVLRPHFTYYVQTPRWPRSYISNKFCEWVFRVPAGRKIFVSGLIHLQNSGQYSCQRDYFQYYWGWPVGAKYERRCGRMNIRKTSKREIAAIRFRSNSHRNFPGFRLAVTMV